MSEGALSGSAPLATGDTAALASEARSLSRYLLGRDCPDEMVARYVQAHRVRLDAGAAARDDVARFAFAHPWSTGLLDTAGALTGRAPVLRAKLHLMCAILEASPRFASEFLPRRASAIGTIARLAACGVVVALKAVVGIPMLLAIGKEPP